MRSMRGRRGERARREAHARPVRQRPDVRHGAGHLRPRLRLRPRLPRALRRRAHPPLRRALQQPVRALVRGAHHARGGRGRRRRRRRRVPPRGAQVLQHPHLPPRQGRRRRRRQRRRRAPRGGSQGEGQEGIKSKAAPLAEWKWDEQRERVLHVMSGVLDVDLWNLFRPRQPPEAFLTMFTSLACAAMGSQTALRSKVTKASAFDMLGACALKWGQLENVTTSLVHLLNKHEHLPGPIAECAAAAADRHRERAPGRVPAPRGGERRPRRVQAPAALRRRGGAMRGGVHLRARRAHAEDDDDEHLAPPAAPGRRRTR